MGVLDMGQSLRGARFLAESRVMDAKRNRSTEWFDLGICYSSGTGGAGIDLVEAHKWFNLAAMSGLDSAQEWRAEIANDMTARQIADAQKAARAFLRETPVN
jgi:TPR repeat protein